MKGKQNTASTKSINSERRGNPPRKSKYNAANAEQSKYQGEIRSRSKNNNDSSIRAKLRKYTNVRVLQKNLVYVIGLSPEIVLDKKDDDLLK